MSKLPLEGIRVLDMTVVWAGPYATSLLAYLGAEVIRIESTKVMPPLTRGFTPHPTKEMIRNLPTFAGGYPNREPGARPWNRFPVFNGHASNKMSMTVDLTTSKGQDIFHRLVSVSDVFIDNNVVETMKKLGIYYEALKSTKDDIVMVRMPAYGDEGTYSTYRALGVHMANALGHGLMRGYPDMDPSSNSVEYTVDAASGTHAAAAVLMALIYKKRTGKGQFIELPSAQTFVSYMAFPFLEYTVAGLTPSTLGNRHRNAIQGCYPCKGYDRWIVITIDTESQWSAFCEVLGNPSWTKSTDFQNHANRMRNHDQLDQQISEWTRLQDDKEVMMLLQKAGVPAGSVLNAKDALEDPHLLARDTYQEAYTTDTGTHRYARAPFLLSETPGAVRRGPVTLGQDNEYVYRQVLGVSQQEYQELQKEGHIGTEFVINTP